MRLLATTMLGLAVVAMLAGCAAPAVAPEPEATETLNPAHAICDDFETATTDLAQLLIVVWDGEATDSEDAELKNFADRFDTLSLEADSELATRLANVRDVLPSGVLPVLLNSEDYFDALSAVHRACEAVGADSDYTTWDY
ncbi:MAG: hypothetical protein ACOH1M_07180 [Rhodoglobus sp.]